MIQSRNDYSFLFSFILFNLFLAVPFSGIAQSFEDGLDLYQQKEYEKAIRTFNKIKSPQGYLFTGKSFYALREYDGAQSNLNNVPEDAPPQIYYEAMYTSALINFQRKNFSDALKKLHEVVNTQIDNGLTQKANMLYEEILNYLTADQRKKAFDSIAYPEVKYLLIESGLGKMEFGEAQKMYQSFLENTDDDEWTKKAESFDSYLSSVSNYRNKYGEAVRKLQPPRGTTYTIGMALPEYQPSAREFDVVRAMYFGAMIAADDFNENSRDAKAYIRFTDTGTSSNGLESMMKQFVENYYGDVVIGPLFSDQAKPMVPIATNFKTPVIAPLANSEIDVEKSFLFQANPTFRIHGKQLAQYAINELGYSNFAVIASQNTKGAQSAFAFREEVQRLGANMHHFVIENLESNEYEMTRYTKDFGNTASIDAVYAPFTGQRAFNLIDLLIANLQSMDINPSILGSQEYKRMSFKENKYRNLNILFSESTFQNERSSDIYQFKNKYDQNFGNSGNQYAMIGYDVARFILETLKNVGNPELLKNAIADYPSYNGLVMDISFDGGNINTAIKVIEVADTGNLRERN